MAALDVNKRLPLVDLGSGDEKVKKVHCSKFLTPGYTTSGHVELHTVRLGASQHCSLGVYSDFEANLSSFFFFFFLIGECGEGNVLGGGNARLGRSEWSR